MRVRTAVVVGAGTMGASIAEVLALNGIEVRLTDVDSARVEAGLARVRASLERLAKFHASRTDDELARWRARGLTISPEQETQLRASSKSRFPPERIAEVLGRIRASAPGDGFDGCDLAIEAVFERYDVKRPVLEALDRSLPEHAVIGTNTSSLSITRLGHGLRHAPRLLALHFFNPPTTLPLVEVAGGLETREEVIAEAIELLQGFQNHRGPLVPIRVRESPAFVVNRILLPVLLEAAFALQEGLAPARDIDLAMKAGAGFPMGPFELADLIGLDVALEVADTLLAETGDPKYRAPPILRRMVDAGFLGRKAGRGFYEYP